MATILIVDDYPDLCRAVVHILNWAGHRATCVTKPEEAMPYVRRNSPDVIVLDVLMVGITGLELLRRLRADATGHGIPVIMYSAHDDDDYRAKATSLGAQGYVMKNIAGFDALIGLIRKLLGDRDNS